MAKPSKHSSAHSKKRAGKISYKASDEEPDFDDYRLDVVVKHRRAQVRAMLEHAYKQSMDRLTDYGYPSAILVCKMGPDHNWIAWSSDVVNFHCRQHLFTAVEEDHGFNHPASFVANTLGRAWRDLNEIGNWSDEQYESYERGYLIARSQRNFDVEFTYGHEISIGNSTIQSQAIRSASGTRKINQKTARRQRVFEKIYQDNSGKSLASLVVIVSKNWPPTGHGNAPGKSTIGRWITDLKNRPKPADIGTTN